MRVIRLRSLCATFLVLAPAGAAVANPVELHVAISIYQAGDNTGVVAPSQGSAIIKFDESDAVLVGPYNRRQVPMGAFTFTLSVGTWSLSTPDAISDLIYDEEDQYLRLLTSHGVWGEEGSVGMSFNYWTGVDFFGCVPGCNDWNQFFGTTSFEVVSSTPRPTFSSTNPANGNTYFLLSPASWSDSEAVAQSLGGHLVTINDQAENDWVFDTFSALSLSAQITDCPCFWIGYSDAAAEAAWVWSSGESPGFGHWSPGEPSSHTAADDYAHMWGMGHTDPGTWNDLMDDGVGYGGDPVFPYGVVEYLPEPSTWLSLGASALVLAGLSRWASRGLVESVSRS